MRETLLGRGIGIILSIILVVLIGGCASIEGILEAERLEQQEEEKNAQLEELYNKIDAIGLEYYSGQNSDLNEEFESFLEQNGISKETIIGYLKRQEIFNNLKQDEYLKQKEILEEKLKKQQISEEEFEKMDQQLEIKYSKSKNKLGEYFRTKEKTIFESSQEEVEKLYNLLNNY